MRDPNAAGAAAVVCLALLLSACSRDQSVAPAAPSVPKQPAGRVFTLSGVVSDRVSGRPLAGVQVAVWPEPAPLIAPGWSAGFGLSDGTGHFKISNWPDWTGTAWVQASKDG